MATKQRSLNPRKLLLSKWTAVYPQNREKHFLVSKLIVNAESEVVGCVLEAVLTGHGYEIAWQDLLDDNRWQMGWH